MRGPKAKKEDGDERKNIRKFSKELIDFANFVSLSLQMTADSDNTAARALSKTKDELGTNETRFIIFLVRNHFRLLSPSSLYTPAPPVLSSIPQEPH